MKELGFVVIALTREEKMGNFIQQFHRYNLSLFTNLLSISQLDWPLYNLLVSKHLNNLLREVLRSFHPTPPPFKGECKMDTQERMPRIKRRRGNFVVEENIDALRWPQECANCGGPVAQTDSLKLSKDVKGMGKIKVEVKGIPYCSACLPKIKWGKRLNSVVFVLAFVIGIPLGLLVSGLMARQQNVNFICCGLIIAVCVFIGYGIALLFAKLPAKLILGKWIAEPVDSWLIEEKKSDGKQGVSVIVSVPNKNYAAKFAQLNGLQV
jgi:hypothetical protein